jgi:signal peptidase I
MKTKRLKNILKFTALGVSCFSIGMILTIAVLSSLPANFWQGFDASSLKSLAGRIPRLYIVQSGSMEPAISTGSVVVSLPKENYVAGDVITFAQKTNSKNLITHRVVFKNFPDGVNGSPTYITAGDANEDFDSAPVTDEQIVGKSILSVPYLGYLANFAKTPYGFIFLVIVPATIIIYEEFKFLLREIKKIFSKISSRLHFKGRTFKGRRTIKDQSPNTHNAQRQSLSVTKKTLSLRSLSILIPMFGASMVFAGLASSYFSDTEKSAGNVFSAAAEFPDITPTPTPGDQLIKLVINEVYYDVESAEPRGQGANLESDPVNEWVEIYNPNAFDVNFKDWQICDNSSCVTVNPNVDVPALGFALVSRDASTWTYWTIPSGVEKVHSLGGTPLALNNDGDRLILLNPDSVEIDRMSFEDILDGFTPNCIGSCPSAGDGQSLEREPDGTDTDTQIDFILREVPSPGS